MQNSLTSLKHFGPKHVDGPEPLVIDAQITKDDQLQIYATEEIFIYENLGRFEGVALT